MRSILLFISTTLIFSYSIAQEKYFEKLFYLDFHPTEKEDSLFKKLHNSVLEMEKSSNFVSRDQFLTESAFTSILKDLNEYPKILADTNTSYRIYFTAFNGFKSFSIFGFGKNYDKYTYVQ